MHSKLRREHKEDYMEARESKEGTGLQEGDLRFALLRVVASSKEVWKRRFQRCVNLDVQKQWTGLAYKHKPLTKEVTCLGNDCPPWLTQLGIYSRSPSEMTFHRTPCFHPQGGTLMDGIRFHTGREVISLSVMWGYSKKVVMCKPGKEPSLYPDHAGSLILDLPASKTVRKNCLFLKSPSLYGIFVAARVD